MAKIRHFLINNTPFFIVLFVALVCIVFLSIGHLSESGEYITLDGKDAQISESTRKFIEDAEDAYIEYAKNIIPTIIINSSGEEEIIEAPTIEYIDGGEILNYENCSENEECGLGTYIYAPTDTYEDFKNYTIGKCWNVDNFAGAQCWDLSSLHAMNYTKDKRVFSTCGTGAAKGMWDCKEQNAGTEYDLVYDIYATNIGDIGVWNGGTWGHTCIIAGPVHDGHVACLGQNQGGSACPGGGAATNIVNISINGFRGAFRPKTYENKPDPTPQIACESWDVKFGDTMGEIMKVCEGQIDWNRINEYADKWFSQKFNVGKSVYWGWTHGNGYGLLAGDTIKYTK